MAPKIMQTTAVIGAEDRTGNTFASISNKLKKMENAAATAAERVGRAARYPAKQAAATMQNALRSASVADAIQGGAAALASSTVVHKIIRESSARLHEQIRMANSGMTSREIASANAEAAKLASQYKPVGQTEILHMIRNARAVVGTYTEAAEIMKPLLDLRVIAQHARPGASAEETNEDFDKLVKSAELAGVTSSMSKFHNYMEGIARVMNVFGDTIKPHQFMEAAQYGRAATMGWSADFVASVLPTMIQHHGGAQAGTAGGAFYSAIVGGKMSNLAVNELNKLGLIDPSKIIRTKTGNVKGVGPGGIYGTDLARSDPNKWINEYLMPALVKHGVTDVGKVAEILARIFSNKVAAQFVTDLATNRSIYDKDAALTKGAKGLDAARDIMAHDFDQAFAGLKNQIDALAAAAGKPFLQPLISGMNLLGDAANRLAQHTEHDSSLAVLGTLGAAGGVAGAGLYGSRALLGLAGIGQGAAGAGAFFGLGAAGLTGAYIGSKLGQGALAIGHVAAGGYYATKDADAIADLRKQRDELEAEIQGIRSRQFDKTAYNPVIDQKSRISRDLANRIAVSESRNTESLLAPVAPGLLAFGMSPSYGSTDSSGWTNWTRRGKRVKPGGRKVSLDEALNPTPRSISPNPALAPPQRTEVSVKATSDPVKVEVSFTAASPLIQAVERMKEATAKMNLATSVNQGTGSNGSTDFGNQQ